MRLFALLLGAVACGTAAAQIVDDRADPLKGAYFSVNVGQSNYKWRNPPPGIPQDLCGLSGLLECRDDPIGWKLTAGYMPWRFFGVELVAYQMGDARIRFPVGASVLEQVIRIEGYGLSAVGALALGPVVLNARAGYAASTATRNDIVDAGPSLRSEKSRAEPLFGAGIGINVWRGLVVRLDWDRARARTALGEKFQADLYSAGIGWRF